MPTLRLKVKKTERIRFLSHLETMKTLERSLRRMNVPFKFSNGYNPHSNISFAAPLPVGIASEYEIVDIDVLEEFKLEELIKNQKEYFPKGFIVSEGIFLEKAPSLMSVVGLSDYKATYDGEIDYKEIESIIDTFLNSEKVMTSKKTKKGREIEVNIRNQVKEMKWNRERNEIFLKLDTGSVSNLKPMILLTHIFPWQEEKIYIIRTKLYREDNRKWLELFD